MVGPTGGPGRDSAIGALLSILYTGTDTTALSAIHGASTISAGGGRLGVVSGGWFSATQGDYNESANCDELSGAIAQAYAGGRSTIGTIAGCHSVARCRQDQVATLTAGTLSDIDVENIVSTNIAPVVARLDIGSLSACTNGAFFLAMPYTGDPSTCSHAYGMYLPDVAWGSSSNYAIYTNDGRVSFGDIVEINGGIAYGAPLTINTLAPNISAKHALHYSDESGSNYNAILPLSSSLPDGWSTRVYNDGDYGITATITLHALDGAVLIGSAVVHVGQIATIVYYPGQFLVSIDTIHT